ncbi:hypothetical protein NQZ79_g1447 [Umbelopsis isabellina]|nr:hypothetical protein NQZ79_g1447 [Umbelopsis isabellina]
MSFWWGQSPFDESVERATSELLPAGQENLALNLEIADQIRGKKINAKDAMRSLKTRLSHKNPNVQLLTLSVSSRSPRPDCVHLVDCCVKNGGDHFVKEVATREFMEELTSIIRAPTGCNLDVKNKILAVVQVWGLASKGKPQLSYITDTYSFLKAEGYVFPPINEHTDSIVLESSAAPEWSDSDVCERCRTTFTMTNRKHHCRQCGKTFCGQCSSKTMPLPHLAITEDVRVCDGCYMKNTLSRIEKKEASALNNSLPPYMQGSSPSKHDQQRSSSISKPPVSSGNDDMDEDLKKAIELSLKEAEQSKNSYSAGYVAPQRVERKPSPQPVAATATDDPEDDPDLAAAIAASLQDMQISQNQASQSRGYRGPSSDDLSTVEMENILLFSTLIDRIRVSSGEVGNDPQVNALYTQIGAIQPKLVKTLDDTMRKHRTFVDLHSKLNQAVKMYDRLLEERLNSTYARNSHPSHERVQSPHQYYASPAAPHAGYSSGNDQNSIYPNASNYNQPQASFPQASTYDQGSESGYAGGQQQPSSTSYMYNAPSSAPYMPTYSTPQHSGSAPPPPQDYNVLSQPPSTAPPQDYQSIPTPQGTAPPQPGYMSGQGYFPPEQGTPQPPPQDSYYPLPTQEAAAPPSHYAPPNEYQQGPPQGYVSPPPSNAQSAPMYAPEAYYPPQQAPPQPEVASPHQQGYGPPSQAPPQQRWDGYPQQPYPQQDRSGYPMPGTAPAQHQQPPVEEAPLIEL